MQIYYKAQMDRDSLMKLFNEINMVKELSHPNILKIEDAFEDKKRLYVVYECPIIQDLHDVLLETILKEREAQ